MLRRVYRLTLQLLPVELRRKHGPGMEALFAREVAQARTTGKLKCALAGAAGVWDVVSRAIYERLRPERAAAEVEHVDSRSRELWNIMMPSPQSADANRRGPRMGAHQISQPTTRQLLSRHATAFAFAFVGLTTLLLLSFARRQFPSTTVTGPTTETAVEMMLLALPFTAAMTIPMAVFLAVLHVFSRLGADGTLDAARRAPGGARRLLGPVLAAAVGMAVLTLVVTAMIVPRANQQLVLARNGGNSAARNDRAMTIGELREAARNVRATAAPDARSQAAAYDVEVQKKLALPAACVVLALVGMAIPFRFPRGGTWLVIGASLTLFSAYYVLLMTGESLADRLVVSPFVGMWGANAIAFTFALLFLWRRAHVAPNRHDAFASSR